jgi:hypothetical protein
MYFDTFSLLASGNGIFQKANISFIKKARNPKVKR